MSGDDAEFVEQPDGARLRTPSQVTRNGGAVRVRSHVQISDTASALVSEKKIKKGQVAPTPYVPHKKWKDIRRFDTSNTVQLYPEYRTYHQYHHERDWMEKSGMKMLLWHILPPLGLVGKAKAVSSHLTWTAWVQFPPFPRHSLPALLMSSIN
jgi:hypothetical protein